MQCLEHRDDESRWSSGGEKLKAVRCFRQRALLQISKMFLLGGVGPRRRMNIEASVETRQSGGERGHHGVGEGVS